jgi:hypothetical protein
VPLSIPNTASTDSFVQWGNGLYVNGWINVLAQTGISTGGGVDVFIQHKPGGGQYPSEQGQVVQLIPGAYPIVGSPLDPVVSVNIRSHVPGSPAQYSGLLVEESKAGIGAGAQLLGSLSATGSFTPVSPVIGGQVDGLGNVTAGAGFTANRTGPGAYSVSLASTVGFCAPAAIANGLLIVELIGASAVGFSIQIATPGGVPTDAPWSFVVATG